MPCNYLKVLDLAKIGSWDEAHHLVQQYSDSRSCLLHAYLHRVEGDLSNAKYWYARAKTEMPDNSLEEEFDRLYSQIEKQLKDA
jgi:hypothetical protein